MTASSSRSSSTRATSASVASGTASRIADSIGMAFALYAENGGGPSVARFSAVHHITSAAAWTAALILMALTEVVGCTAVFAGRALRT